MAETTAPTKARYVYILDPSFYFIWSEGERLRVEEWLRLHEIEPRDVLVGNTGQQIAVTVDESGYYELVLWVTRRNEAGETLRCPHCPSCLQQERIARPAVAPWPAVATGMWHAP